MDSRLLEGTRRVIRYHLFFDLFSGVTTITLGLVLLVDFIHFYAFVLQNISIVFIRTTLLWLLLLLLLLFVNVIFAVCVCVCTYKCVFVITICCCCCLLLLLLDFWWRSYNCCSTDTHPDTLTHRNWHSSRSYTYTHTHAKKSTCRLQAEYYYTPTTNRLTSLFRCLYIQNICGCYTIALLCSAVPWLCEVLHPFVGLPLNIIRP